MGRAARLPPELLPLGPDLWPARTGAGSSKQAVDNTRSGRERGRAMKRPKVRRRSADKPIDADEPLDPSWWVHNKRTNGELWEIQAPNIEMVFTWPVEQPAFP